RRQDPGKGSVRLRLRRADRRVRQPRVKGHHRPDQGGAHGAAGRSLCGRTAHHDRGDGRRGAKEAGARHAARGRRNGRRHGLLATRGRTKRERPGGGAGAFLWVHSAGATTRVRDFSTPLTSTAMTAVARTNPSAMVAVVASTSAKPPGPCRSAIVETAAPAARKVRKYRTA